MIIIAIRTLLFQLFFIFFMLKLRFVYVPRLILPILPALIRNVSLSSASSFVANESHLYCSGSGFFGIFLLLIQNIISAPLAAMLRQVFLPWYSASSWSMLCDATFLCVRFFWNMKVSLKG